MDRRTLELAQEYVDRFGALPLPRFVTPEVEDRLPDLIERALAEGRPLKPEELGERPIPKTAVS